MSFREQFCEMKSIDNPWRISTRFSTIETAVKNKKWNLLPYLKKIADIFCFEMDNISWNEENTKLSRRELVNIVSFEAVKLLWTEDDYEKDKKHYCILSGIILNWMGFFW